MEWGDRLFWGMVFFIGIIFLWVGLLERFVPLWVGAIVGFFALFAMLKYGPRPKEKEEERKGA